MSYDPARVTISDWDNELVSDTKLNQMLNNIDHNYKYSPKMGPDFAGTYPKIARGQVTFVWSSETSKQTTVTFATDSDDGDPGFTTIPRIIIAQEYRSGDSSPVSCQSWGRVSDPSTTQFTIYVVSDEHGTTISGTQRVNWIALGY